VNVLTDNKFKQKWSRDMKKILMKRDPYLILYFIMQPLAAICDVLSAKALADAVDFAIRGRLDGIFR